MRLNKKCALFFTLFLIIFISCVMPAAAKENETQQHTIRVAFPSQPGLTDIDEYGEYTGYTYDYLQEIAQYTGWNYEFIQVPGGLDESLTALMEMLKNGEADIMGGMLYNEQMEKQYDYASHSYGIVYTVLQVLYDDMTFDTDSQTEQRMRVAVLRSSNKRREELDEYCKMNLVTPEYVECDTEEELIQALRDGRADALLNTSLNSIDGVRTVAKFSPKPFYFVITKGRTDLLKDLNQAIQSVEQADPYFSTVLFEKYFSQQPSELLLSEEEKNYIANAETVRVGVQEDLPPFQYKDQETGELKGIAVELLHHIQEMTGLQFELTGVKDEETLDAMAAEGKVDLVAAMTYDYKQAADRGLAMTRPYISAQYIMLLNENVNADSIAGKRLALPVNFEYDGEYVGKVVRYPTKEACVQAVDKGQADYTYLDGYIAQYYFNRPEYTHFYLVPQTYQEHSTCFGLVKPVDRRLLSIMNKALATFPNEHLQNIIYQNTVLKTEPTLGLFIRQNPSVAVLTVSIISLIIVGMLADGLYNRIKMNRKMVLELEKRKQVFELANDFFFEYDYKKDSLTINYPGQNGKIQGNRTFENLELQPEDTDAMKEHKEKFISLIRSGEDGVHEIKAISPDGTLRWFSVAMKTIRGDSGRNAYVVGKINDIEERKKEKERLESRAQRDSLTHIYNAETCRSMMKDYLNAMKSGDNGALLLIDVDNFKAINDNFGHMKGDQVLIEVASVLKDSFRSEDVVGRPGGDEFFVYMKNVKDRKSLSEKCEVIRLKLRQILLDDEGRHITVSIGVAPAVPGESYDTLYNRADGALYKSKETGRDKFTFAD